MSSCLWLRAAFYEAREGAAGLRKKTMSAWGNNPFGNDDAYDENAVNPFTEQQSSPAESLIIGEPLASPKRKASLKKNSRNGKEKKLEDATIFSGNASSRDQYEAETFAKDVSQSELELREQELQEREAQLSSREMEAAHAVKITTPNYPPFPSFCCMKPWVVHHINEHIPDSFRRQQRMYFIYFHCWMAMMWLNVVSCGIQMKVTDLDVPLEDPLVSLILSIIYAIFLVPIGFYFRYWSLYKAISKKSSVRMIWHLLMDLFNTGWAGMMASGVWKVGSGGFQGGMVMEKYDHKFSMTWLYACGGLFLLDSLISFICFVYFWYFWRNGGLKFTDTTAEATTVVASNKTVQKAAFRGAKKGFERV